MATLIDSYSETNQDDFSGLDTVTDGNAQSFTATALNLYSAKWYLRKSGTPTVTNMVAKLYAHTGTFGAAGSAPTSAALATSDPTSTSALTSSFALYEFLFTGANQYTLTNGTHYFISLEATLSAGGVDSGIDVSSPTHAGWSTTHSSGVWDDAGWDYCFYVYGISAAGGTPISLDERPFRQGLKLYP